MLYTAVYVLRFVQALFKRKNRKFNVPEWGKISPSGAPDFGDLNIATLLIVRMEQNAVKNEIAGLQIINGEADIIRLKSRLGKSSAPKELQNPIILPKNSRVTQLIIEDIHNSLLHSGVDSTLTQFLSQFWTRHSRRTVQRMIRQCSRCRRINGPAFALPMMPPLPADRGNTMAPFTSVGIDYMGPSIVKVGGESKKCWIVIITCLCTRAVYLAPVLDMSTKTLLHILQRFCARRGTPQRILSDNGTSFVLASKIAASHEIRKGGPDELNIFLNKKGILWRFLPALNPWGGAVYERLIAICKSCFKRTLGRRVLTYEEMETFVCKVEGVMNCRPLTFVSDEAAGPRVLCPKDFLCPEGTMEFHFPGDENSSESEEEYGINIPTKAEQIRKYFDSIRSSLHHFWRKWQTEYMLMLRERSEWFHKGPRSQITREPKVGEVVLIKEEKFSRNLWPIGRISKLLGEPGQIRNVILDIPGPDSKAGDSKFSVPKCKSISRPINLLYPLEVLDGPNKDGQAATEKSIVGSGEPPPKKWMGRKLMRFPTL